MVKFLATSITFVILSIATVQGQGQQIVIADYPAINQIPAIDTPQVKAWLAELGDLSGAPNIPLPNPTAQPPPCAAKPLPGE